MHLLFRNFPKNSILLPVEISKKLFVYSFWVEFPMFRNLNRFHNSREGKFETRLKCRILVFSLKKVCAAPQQKVSVVLTCHKVWKWSPMGHLVQRKILAQNFGRRNFYRQHPTYSGGPKIGWKMAHFFLRKNTIFSEFLTEKSFWWLFKQTLVGGGLKRSQKSIPHTRIGSRGLPRPLESISGRFPAENRPFCWCRDGIGKTHLRT